MCKLILVAFLALLAMLTMAGRVQAQPALHTAKQFLPGALLTDIDAQGEWVFRQGEQTQSLPTNQLVRWSADRRTMPSPAVALADGSWLAGQVQWLTDRRVRVESKWFESVELDIDALRAIMVNPTSSWPETQLLQSQMLSVTGSQDVLWKRGSESASGIVTIQIKKSVDATGPDRAVWSFKPQTVTSSTEVLPNNFSGVSFSPILRRPTLPCTTCAQLKMVDGCRLIVKGLKRRGDGRVEINLSSGVDLVSLDEANQFVLSIAEVTAQPAGVSWLSDMEPARYRLLDSDSKVPWPLGRNRDLFGKPLFAADGQSIEHALVIHSPAQAAYRWNGQASRLMATIEILETPNGGSSVSALGSVQCQVLLGRDGQLVKAWQSETLRYGQPPVLVEATIGKAQLVVLLVDQADMGTLGDHVLWRDVRVVPE